MVDGQKFDAGKVRLDLIPPELLFGVGSVLTFGATKYGDRNWENGIKWSRVFAALMRHMWAWWKGEKLDPETGMSHLWHAGCCVAFLIAYEDRGMTSFDDRLVAPLQQYSHMQDMQQCVGCQTLDANLMQYDPIRQLISQWKPEETK